MDDLTDIIEENRKIFLEKLNSAFAKSGYGPLKGGKIGYNFKYAGTEDPGLLTIYTDIPGALIGYKGERIDALRKNLEEEFHGTYVIRLVQIDGFITI